MVVCGRPWLPRRRSRLSSSLGSPKVSPPSCTGPSPFVSAYTCHHSSTCATALSLFTSPMRTKMRTASYQASCQASYAANGCADRSGPLPRDHKETMTSHTSSQNRTIYIHVVRSCRDDAAHGLGGGDNNCIGIRSVKGLEKAKKKMYFSACRAPVHSNRRSLSF